MKRWYAGRKFIAVMFAMTGLFLSAWTGTFSGELGAYVSGIVSVLCGADTLITRKALAEGADPNPAGTPGE